VLGRVGKTSRSGLRLPIMAYPQQKCQGVALTSSELLGDLNGFSLQRTPIFRSYFAKHKVLQAGRVRPHGYRLDENA
jgi:hypothetical protein